MSDKKNFSVLGKIDEKYVEEADAYSVSSEGSRVSPKRRRTRSFVLRAAGIAAACALIVGVGVFALQPLFEGKKDMAAAPENFDSKGTETTDCLSCSTAPSGEAADGGSSAADEESGENSSESEEENSEESEEEIK